MKQKLMNYEEPTVDVMAVEVEKGFAATGDINDLIDGGEFEVTPLS